MVKDMDTRRGWKCPTVGISQASFKSQLYHLLFALASVFLLVNAANSPNSVALAEGANKNTLLEQCLAHRKHSLSDYNYAMIIIIISIVMSWHRE